MSKFKLEKLNNQVVKKVPLLMEQDERPIKGADLFDTIYSNIFLCAKKNSGKSSCIYKILKECCGRDTKIFAFVGTLNKDQNWKTIQAWAEHKGLPFIGNTSLKDGKIDLLDELVQELSLGIEDDSGGSTHNGLIDLSDSHDEEVIPIKKEKYLAPEIIIILDDLSSELRSASVASLLKKNRHFKCKVILSTQHLHDLLPESLRQIDYWLLFRGHPDDKLALIHKDADMQIPFSQFKEIYQYATRDPFNFLYVDARNDTFRKNFNTKISVD